MWLSKTKDMTKEAVPTQINPGAWRQGVLRTNQKKKQVSKGDAKAVGTLQTTSADKEALEQAVEEIKSANQELIKREASQSTTLNNLQAELRELKKALHSINKDKKINEAKRKPNRHL